MFFVVFSKAQTNQTLSLNTNGQASLNLEDLNLTDCFDLSYFTPSKAIGEDHASCLSNNSYASSSTDFAITPHISIIFIPIHLVFCIHISGRVRWLNFW
jgi:hypothetical protein